MSAPLDRRLLREAADVVESLAPVATQVHAHRATTRAQGDTAARELLAPLAEVRPPGAPRWRVLPLGPGDDERLGHLAAAAALHPLTDDQERVVADLASDLPAAADETRVLHGIRRFFTGRRRREAAEAAARRLLEGYAVWGGEHTRRLLDRLAAQTREPALPFALDQALSPRIGLLDQLGPPDRRRSVIPVGPLSGLPAAARLLAPLLAQEQTARQAAEEAGDDLREEGVRTLLEQMPVERLREATRERLRVSALEDAGLTSIAAVLDHGDRIRHLPGVGDLTARRMLGAAETLRTLATADARITFDQHHRTPAATRLLRALHTWEVLRQAAKAHDIVVVAHALLPLAERMRPGTTHLAVLSDGADAADLRDLVLPVLERAEELGTALRSAGAGDPWADFLRRPSDYFALLSELGLVEETGTFGDLPEDVIEAVRDQELDVSLLEVSLRGYQAFAARFALVQEKVLVGDEMGLGKTIEALAVLAHLATQGRRWFLVVCPASVVTGWTREVRSRTGLEAHRVHGPMREEAMGRWRAEGGVAVTTYATLGRVWDELDGFELDALVVDEAHYVKNPRARRSQRVAALTARTQHVILLTGTPLENRTEEFATLVGYLRPDLLDGHDGSPVGFRRAVAPVYLRRNVEDVLVELPDLVEVEDWLELSPSDQRAYLDAVAEGSFPAMRRAAFVSGTSSAKLARLIEIVEEAEDNGRRVLVFSYFRDVLDEVAAALPGPVFGPLTGSVPPAQRQEIVDAFSTASGGAALVAQIQAGGIGLNIQAASVVVLCEPQVKPTTEWQAIARARRMGQLETVQVHRLLAEDSVDERMLEILSGKSDLFDRYARVSETAESAPEAYDVSEADLVRQVVAAERERLFPDGVTLGV